MAVVIPAYNPGDSLITLVESLSEEGFKYIVIVNDGSSTRCASIFAKIRNTEAVSVIDVPVNSGKGAALKRGFQHILDLNDASVRAVVTADADGQHAIGDIVMVAQLSASRGDAMVLGVRSFGDNVPWRSRFGNELTKRVFRLFTGKRLQDTQTGLRGVPVRFLNDLVALSTNRYEYELEVLLNANKWGAELLEVPISTIYIDDNASSHFNPVLDSIRVYSVFVRYTLSSAVSFAVDIVFFVIFRTIFNDIIISSYCARLVSGTTNFFINKYAVFRSVDRRHTSREMTQYVILAIFIVSLSAFLVDYFSEIAPKHVVMIKVVVDLSLFVLNFLVQRVVVFVSGRAGTSPAG